MKLITILAAIAILTLAAAAGCSGASATGTPPVTSTSGQQADDVLPTPGGYAYRGNVTQQGHTNPFAHIDTVDVALGSGHVTYRAEIDSAPGQSHYNIVSVYQPLSPQSAPATLAVSLSLNSLPAGTGITASAGDHWNGPGNTQTIVTFMVAAGTAAGDYTLDINITVNGTLWGSLSCTLHVSA